MADTPVQQELDKDGHLTGATFQVNGTKYHAVYGKHFGNGGYYVATIKGEHDWFATNAIAIHSTNKAVYDIAAAQLDSATGKPAVVAKDPAAPAKPADPAPVQPVTKSVQDIIASANPPAQTKPAAIDPAKVPGAVAAAKPLKPEPTTEIPVQMTPDVIPMLPPIPTSSKPEPAIEKPAPITPTMANLIPDADKDRTFLLDMGGKKTSLAYTVTVPGAKSPSTDIYLDRDTDDGHHIQIKIPKGADGKYDASKAQIYQPDGQFAALTPEQKTQYGATITTALNQAFPPAKPAAPATEVKPGDKPADPNPVVSQADPSKPADPATPHQDFIRNGTGKNAAERRQNRNLNAELLAKGEAGDLHALDTALQEQLHGKGKHIFDKNGKLDVKALQADLKLLGIKDEKGHTITTDGNVGDQTVQVVKTAMTKVQGDKPKIMVAQATPK